MSDIRPSTDHYLAEFARRERHLPGGKAIGEYRHAGLRRFADAGFPSTRQEDWKYTDLRPIEKRAFEGADEPAHVSGKDLTPYLIEDLDAHRLVVVDGHFVAELSDIGELPSGIQLTSLAARLDAGDAPGAPLGDGVNGHANPFTAMNDAFLSDGLYLSLDAGAVLDKPVHLLIVASDREEIMSHVRNVVRMGENSQATLIEHYVGLGESPYFTNAVTEVESGAGSRLDRCRLQQEGARGYHVSSFHGHQTRDAKLFNYGIDLGGRLVRADTNTRLDAEGAEIHLYGVYAPTGRQHIDNHTRVDHAKPHGISREAYRGILDGRGRGVFNGKVIVHKDAQKTDSEQSSDALLLSKKAEVDAKPELEIYADDVKCAHGSTVGQLDEDAVFYLRSRGLDEAGARAVLTYSFADELIEHLEPEPLRRYAQQALLAKLPGGSYYTDLA